MSEEGIVTARLRAALKEVSGLLRSEFPNGAEFTGFGRIRVGLPYDGYAVVFDEDGGLQLDGGGCLRPAHEANERILWMVVEAVQVVVIMLYKSGYTTLNSEATEVVKTIAVKLREGE